MVFYDRKGTLPHEVDQLDPIFVANILARWDAEYDLDTEPQPKG